MGFLAGNLPFTRRIPLAGLAAGLALGLAAGPAAACSFLSDWSFLGCAQGRFTGLPGSADPLPPLPGWFAGEDRTQVLFKRLDLVFSTPLPWAGWELGVSAGLPGTSAKINDAWIGYQPWSGAKLKAGRFRVPFGLEPQTSSGALDTVERALIYQFGNFGWGGPLGLDVVGERDYGMRADVAWPEQFAGFMPFVQSAVVTGNGLGAKTGGPSQIMARVGASSRLEMDEIRHELTMGLSASYARQHILLASRPARPAGAAALEPQPFPGEDTRAAVTVVGVDMLSRMNDLVVKAEGVSRNLGGRLSQGFYVTGLLDLTGYGAPGLVLVARWEEIQSSFSDGVHLPNAIYQAVTGGINWRFNRFWRLQADYICLLIDRQPHQFAGSDLAIVQLQLDF